MKHPNQPLCNATFQTVRNLLIDDALRWTRRLGKFDAADWAKRSKAARGAAEQVIDKEPGYHYVLWYHASDLAFKPSQRRSTDAEVDRLARSVVRRVSGMLRAGVRLAAAKAAGLRLED